jgi:hypothetical protein
MDYKQLEELNQWCHAVIKKIMAGGYEENDPQMMADIVGLNIAQNTMFEYIKKLEGKTT